MSDARKAREAAAPFDAMTRELFARNYNRTDRVMSLLTIAKDGESTEVHLTFGDFLDLRAALSALDQPSTGMGDARSEMLHTAKELRDNSNGDCAAIQQAIYWEKKAAALDQPSTGSGVACAGEPRWGAYWYGSEPNKGANIWTINRYGMRSDLILHIGPDQEHLDLARAICTLHNQRAALDQPSGVRVGEAWGRFARAICESEGRNWLALDNPREDCERWIKAGQACAALDLSVIGAEGSAPNQNFETLVADAKRAATALYDWTCVNEAEWTGWGECEVPPGAKFWRVKAGQAVKALSELPSPPEPRHD